MRRNGLPMNDDPLHAQIAKLETRIEALAQSMERGRKIALAARGAIMLGAMLFAAIALGVIRFDALPLLAALSALLGGIVLFGSNRDRKSTRLNSSHRT